jgi:2'-5' RNA ligase
MPVVIVAIAAKDDPVWKISSEKVPHMTLLNLGDKIPDNDVPRITNFLGHVAATSMRIFGMDVDRRGELGPDKADVLFFGDFGLKLLKDICSFLRTNPEIDKAFHSTEQFPDFVPHLTLGWPATPAKPDNREFPGIGWVNFDRIALWTGDSTGPEYLLPSRNDMSVVAMSDPVADMLEHHGVKGMRWGVRHMPGGATVGSPTADAQEADKSKKKIKVGGTHALSTKELSTLVTRMNLEQQYSRLVSSQPTSLGKGHEKVKQLLNLANTGVQIFNLANSAAAKAGVAVVKAAISKG